MKSPRHQKRTAWFFISLALLFVLCLSGGSARAQGSTPTSGPYPTPIGPYPSPETGQETATLPPTTAPTLATTSAASAPAPTLQLTAALPSPTLEPAIALPGAQGTLDLQDNPQSNGPAPTYVPLPAITFQIPDLGATQVALQAQAQTSPTPFAAPDNRGAERWVPLAVILVIWGLLAGWFYLSFRRLG
jgi:hypothetical protein